jgi:hypothetical protein
MEHANDHDAIRLSQVEDDMILDFEPPQAGMENIT